MILKRAADTLERCFSYSRPRPSYLNSTTCGLYPTSYKSPLNDGLSSAYTNGGFVINTTNSHNGQYAYLRDRQPNPLHTPAYLSPPSGSSTTDENRIILNGTSGSLPSVSTLTAGCNNNGTATYSMTGSQQQGSPMLPGVLGSSFSAGYSNLQQISPRTTPTGFGMQASPCMITGATG